MARPRITKEKVRPTGYIATLNVFLIKNHKYSIYFDYASVNNRLRIVNNKIERLPF